MASEKIAKPGPKFSPECDPPNNLAYIKMEEQELATFIQNIKDAHLDR